MIPNRGRFAPEFLDAIRDRVPLADIVSPHVALKRAGREFKGLSPFKTEKTPSFTVVPEKGFYHCFASGEHGNVIDFVMKIEGLSFPEAVEKLAARAGLDMPESGHGGRVQADTISPALPAPAAPKPRADNKPFATRIWNTAQTGESVPMRRMLVIRGLWPPGRPLPPVMRWLDREHAARAGIRLNGWPEAAVGAIVYAFVYGREPVAIQIETLDAAGERHAWADTGAKRKSLGPASGASFRLQGRGRVLHVLESPSSALALNTWTLAPAWCSAGASTLPALAADLSRTGAAHIILDVDNDPAGRKHALALQDALLQAGCACSIRWAPSVGVDPADEATADFCERRAILETEGLTPFEAALQTWRDCPPPTLEPHA